MQDTSGPLMNPSSAIQAPPGVAPLSVGDLMSLQDQLFVAATDLDRLSGLLEDAAVQLMQRFGAADAGVQRLSIDPEVREALRHELGEAVTALQFQDMATQVISLAVQRIRGVADFLGARIPSDEEELAAEVQLVNRSCPVAQREVDAGSVELF